MSYFSYHRVAKKLIASGKLIKYTFVENYNGISPALLLFFDDKTHPIMPIREHRFSEYIEILQCVTLPTSKD